MIPPRYRNKVVAYVMREADLLVFAHLDAPEAGIQVPAGTIEPGETPRQAVLREIREESGLDLAGPPRLLGLRVLDMRPWGTNDIHVRWFFQATCPSGVPDEWIHVERHAGDGSGPHRFGFSWVALDRARLIAGFDALLGAVR